MQLHLDGTRSTPPGASHLVLFNRDPVENLHLGVLHVSRLSRGCEVFGQTTMAASSNIHILHTVGFGLLPPLVLPRLSTRTTKSILVSQWTSTRRASMPTATWIKSKPLAAASRSVKSSKRRKRRPRSRETSVNVLRRKRSGL